MKEFWNERYQELELAYGDAPNTFFKQELDKIATPGKILLPLEGQGRNAIYAAQKGWHVVAFDFSESGKASALELAKRFNVEIDYRIDTMEDFNATTNEFDVIALIYAHLPENNRESNHRKLTSFLKSGGTFIIEGFEKSQLNYTSGGPKKESMLYSKELLSSDFSSLDIVICSHEIVHLNEGKYHEGKASVIQFVGKKK